MKEKVSIGLDVGNHRINMVRLTNTPTGLKLLDFASISLNHKLGKEEKLEQLEKVVREKGLAGFPVNIGVSGESVIVRYIDLPRMKKDEIAQALKFEAQKYIPFKIEEVIFDYHILEPLSANGNKMKVLLVAAKRQVIMESFKLIQQAGLKSNLIEVNSFSLINCFQVNGPKIKENDVFALVNLELDLVNVDILQGELPFFTRDISLSKDALPLDNEMDKEKEPLERFKPFLANLIHEIRLSIHYFESEFEKQVYVIYLSGKESGNAELISLFNSQLERNVQPWNPLESLLIDSTVVDIEVLKKCSSMLTLACGLALRGIK